MLPTIYDKIIWDDLTGQELFDKLQILDLGNKTNSNNYIDFIKLEDFPPKIKIMRGIDIFKRHFIAIKCKYRNYRSQKWNNCVFTIFQRYTNDPSLFVLVGNPVKISGGSSSMSDGNKWEKINELLREGNLGDSMYEFKFKKLNLEVVERNN
jgi:hypothetical protein